MLKKRILFLVLLIVSSCSGGQNQTQSKRGDLKKPAGPSDTSDDAQPTPKDCAEQWTLAIKQQHTGAVFTYQSKIQSPYITKDLDRVDTITESSDAGISRTVAINDEMIRDFISGMANQKVSITKQQFITNCSGEQSQPYVASVMGGQASFNPPIDDVVTISGKSIKVKKYVGRVTNVTYAGSTINADIIAYLSPQYPALPLKQVISISSSSLSIITGAQITDVLKSSLPAAQ
jgi:hypothetical protein